MNHLALWASVSLSGYEGEKQDGLHICGGIVAIKSLSFTDALHVLDTELSIYHIFIQFPQQPLEVGNFNGLFYTFYK